MYMYMCIDTHTHTHVHTYTHTHTYTFNRAHPRCFGLEQRGQVAQVIYACVYGNYYLPHSQGNYYWSHMYSYSCKQTTVRSSTPVYMEIIVYVSIWKLLFTSYSWKLLLISYVLILMQTVADDSQVIYCVHPCVPSNFYLRVWGLGFRV